MLARRLPGILPPPSFEEALEITQVHSAAGIGNGRLATERPFRAPHHTISAQGLVGGGTRPMPGEITLAHRGVLFLDELPEFARGRRRRAAAAARGGPGRDHARSAHARLPGERHRGRGVQPLPCARPPDRCACTTLELARYQRRLSGPLVDRIDLVCQVEAVPAAELVGAPERRRTLRARCARAWWRRGGASSRGLPGTGVLCNGDMDGRLTRRQVPLDGPLAARLLAIRDRIALSGRGHDRVLRVARTIADLEGRELVAEKDVDEALSYRLDAWQRVERDARQLRRLPAPRLPDRPPRAADSRACSARAPAGAGLLALPEDDLIAAAAGRQVERALAFLEAFDVGDERARLVDGDTVWRVCTRLATPAPRSARPAGGAVRRRLRRRARAARRGARRDGRRHPPGEPVRHRGGVRARAGTGRRGGACGQRTRARHRRHRSSRLPRRRRRAGGGGGERPGCGLSAPPPVPPRSASREAGLVLSELPPGTEPYRWSFPARNRIMAGLARMTLVVEAADPSGSLITAEFAKDLGRCVAAVPGRDHVERRPRDEQPAEGRRHADQRDRGRAGRAVRRRRPVGRPSRPTRRCNPRPGPPRRPRSGRGERLRRDGRARRPAALSPRRGPRSVGSRRRAISSAAISAAGSAPRAMTDPRRRLGARGEELAARHLEARGYEVVERNFRTRYGELDVVVRDSRFLVFCEVKTRIVRDGAGASTCSGRSPPSGRASSGRCGPWRASGSGRARLEGPRPSELRFDAIGVSFDPAGRLLALEHLEAAF